MSISCEIALGRRPQRVNEGATIKCFQTVVFLDNLVHTMAANVVATLRWQIFDFVGK